MKCIKCKDELRHKIFDGTSWLSTIFIAIVPKCSLCIVAYSSAITICGGKDLYLTHSNWLSYMPILFSAIVIGMIAYNKKDDRTYFAILMALIGAFILLAVREYWISEAYYYMGSVLLFLAVWINGSLFSIINKLKKKISFSHLWLK